MNRHLKIGLTLFLIVALAAVWYFGSYFLHVAYIGAGYKAKVLCSSVFVSNRDASQVLNEDLSDPKLNIIGFKIDHEKKQVITTAPFGIVKRIATYRKGLGATLDLEPKDQKISLEEVKPPAEYSLHPWPKGNLINLNDLPAEVDRSALSAAIDAAFAEPDSTNWRRTRAVVVVYKGQIIAERYAEGITPDTPLLGWSMTKSVTNALIGILVAQGRLSLAAPAPVSEWQASDDSRSKITLDNLLRMSSGLEFGEQYSSLFSDVVLMLYREKDAAGFAINKPLIHKPGTHWSYSSGTTNILSSIIRQTFEGNDRAYLEFPRKALFHRIGMYSAVVEPDASGTLVGSSYMYATARDWARFGLLFLQDGVWDGEPILPAGWVRYSLTPTELAPHGKYGAHWWLNPRGIPIYDDQLAASLPSDLFSARGHHDQYITVIPSKSLVVVRLGLTLTNNTWNQAEFIAQVLEAIK